MFLELTKNTRTFESLGEEGTSLSCIHHVPNTSLGVPSVPFPGGFSQNQVKFHTTGHQDVRSQNYWTPGSNTREQCGKHPFNQELKQDTMYSSIKFLASSASHQEQ